MAFDITEKIEFLSQERYRAIIIHAVPDKSKELSQFLKNFAKEFGGYYMNLLEMFVQFQEMSEKLDIFRLEDLQLLLIKESKDYSIIIVDQADFLLDSWRKPGRQNFYRFLSNQWDGYKQGMESILIVGLQTSSEVNLLNLHDSTGESRVYQLAAFNDIF